MPKIANQKKNNRSKLIIVSGPSGAGKNAVTQAVIKKLPNAARLVTCTTRSPRPNEKNGRDYYFLSKIEFEKRIKANEFLEWAKVHDAYYGNSKKILAKLQKKYQTIILVIDVQGAASIRRLKIPHISIFITAESQENLINRLKKRAGGMPENLLKLRLKSAIKEMREAKKYDYQVINYENKLNQTISKVYKIIQKSS